MADLDCRNLFGVEARGERVLIPCVSRRAIPRDQALNLAAWLVATADPVGTRFLALYSAITHREEPDVLERWSREERTPPPEGEPRTSGHPVWCQCNQCHDRRIAAEQGIDMGKPPMDATLGGEG